jgi:hypothetical protein
MIMLLRKTLIATGCLLAVSTFSYAGSDWLKGTTEEQLKTLAELQPGLGTVMIEYSTRYSTMYYAAKGGNWGMADYQLKEMREIQEVGENTRPARAPMLKSFESSFLDQLAVAIKAKDWKKFKSTFEATTDGCNGCHTANGFAFVKYQLPKSSPSPTSVKP